MKNLHCRHLPCALVLGLSLTVLSGCQTWTWDSGMTLPSGHYLQHRPQYIPKTPDFPLSRELANMEAQGVAESPIQPGRLPAPLPGP